MHTSFQQNRMPKRKRSQWTSWICGWWIVCTLSLWATARAADSIHDADSIRLYESSRQMYDQLEILHNQQKQQAAQKLDSIYQLQEKNRLIQQQQEEIRFSNERLWYIGIGLVLLLIFTSWLIVQQVQIRKKNRFLVQKIQESLTIRQQLFETQQQIQALQEQMETNPQPPTKPAAATSSPEEMTRDRQLFLQIESYVLEEKRFLQPTLTLDDLMLRFLLSKSRLVRLLRQQTGGNLNDWLNQLKLDYSIHLMQEYPQYTIDAIVEESGFQSRRTYYRLFRERYDMTPSEYKRTLAQTTDPTSNPSLFRLGSLILCLLLAISFPLFPAHASYADWRTVYDQLTRFAEGQLAQRLAVVDSLETAQAFRPYELQMLRAGICLYNGGDLNDAIQYGQQAYEDPQCRQDSMKRLDLLELMASCHLYLSHYEESMIYTTEGIQLARALKDPRMELCFLYNMGQLKRQQGLREEAEPYLNQAVHLMEQLYQEHPSADLVDLMCYYYQLRSHNYEADGRKTEAVQLLDRLEQLFADAEQMPDMDQSLLDCRKAEIYSFYANLLINCQMPQRAEQAYQHYLATDYSQTPEGESLRYNYLQGTGRYNEALHYLRKREAQLIQEGNQDTYEHKNLLSIIVGIYEKQGAYGLAAQTYQEMSRISTLLAESDQKAASLELISLYESNEKKQTIHNQQVALRHIYEREFAIGISLLLLFLLTLWLLWQRWRIERKNRSLVQQIERSISDKQALQEVRQTLLALQTADRQPVPQPSGQPTSPVSEPEPKANPEANASDLQSEQLFQQIDAYIRREQLFVQPAFSPDQLLLQFFISKSRLTRLIRTYTGGSFNEYVNNLRLDYSLQLMRENPQYTIEAIAEESGFQSRRTFYRLFRNRYEMTPSEYKQTKQSIQ